MKYSHSKKTNVFTKVRDDLTKKNVQINFSKEEENFSVFHIVMWKLQGFSATQILREINFKG